MVSYTLHTLKWNVSDLSLFDIIEEEITFPQNRASFPPYA